jgi:hypothetical protein
MEKDKKWELRDGEMVRYSWVDVGTGQEYEKIKVPLEDLRVTILVEQELGGLRKNLAYYTEIEYKDDIVHMYNHTYNDEDGTVEIDIPITYKKDV